MKWVLYRSEFLGTAPLEEAVAIELFSELSDLGFRCFGYWRANRSTIDANYFPHCFEPGAARDELP